MILVKLQKKFAYKYKDKEHYKHIVTIPDDVLEQLGWNEGAEIQQVVKNHQLIFKLADAKHDPLKFES